MNTHINGKTPVQLPLWQLVSGAVGLLVTGVIAFWALASWTSEGLRHDVTDIRDTLKGLQGSDKDNAINIGKAQIDFTKQVGDLNVTLAKFGDKVDVFSGKLDTVNQSIDRLSGQIDTVRQQIAARQTVTVNQDMLIEALQKAGLNGQKIIVLPVPYEVKPR